MKKSSFPVVLLVMSMAAMVLTASETAEKELYRKGYLEGTQSLKNQFEAQGWRQQKIIFKNYIVMISTKDLAKNDIAYLCSLARNAGYSPIITLERIVFGDYDRLADATYNAQYINQRIGIETKTEEVSEKHFYTYPVFQDIYKQMEEDIKSKNEVLVITESIIKAQPCKKAKTKVIYKNKGRKVTYFRVSDTWTQSYKYKGDGTLYDDAAFEPYRIISDLDQLYRKGKIVTSESGEKYIQIYDTDVYFKVGNTKILQIYI